LTFWIFVQGSSELKLECTPTQKRSYASLIIGLITVRRQRNPLAAAAAAKLLHLRWWRLL